MNIVRRILVALAIICLAAFCLVYFSSQLTATVTDRVVESAADRQQVFDSMALSLERGDISTQYAALESKNAQDYAFITYTVQMEGFNVLPAEWAVLGLTPIPGDVVLIQGAPQDMAPLGGAVLTATLLTRADQADAPRSLFVEYYILGKPHIVQVRPLSR